ncbi:MAG: hypothetical protein AB8B69_09650 [Chitinophagales bacterium]
MNIQKKIEKHFNEKKFSRITRKISKNWEVFSRGYIIAYSDSFIVIQETEDFKLLGLNILPIKDIVKIRYNQHDKYYDEIMGWENEKEKIELNPEVNLSSWKDVFESLQEKQKNIVVECESSKINSFTIGSIMNITNKSVHILYFDAAGFLDKGPTKIKFKNISKVMFEDRYIDIFSKYLR